MAQRGQRRDAGGPPPTLPGAQAVGEDAEEQHRQRQGDRERVLAGHRRGDVAAVDRERLVEQEDDRGHRQQRRVRELQTGEAAERPGRDGQADDAEDTDDLEGHAVGQQQVEADDHERGDDHVELVHREAGVPVGGPPGQAPVRQDVVAQIRGSPHVRPHVAAGRRGVAEDQARVELGERVPRAQRNDADRDEALDQVPRVLRRRETPLVARVDAGPVGRSGLVDRFVNCRVVEQLGHALPPPTGRTIVASPDTQRESGREMTAPSPATRPRGSPQHRPGLVTDGREARPARRR